MKKSTILTALLFSGATLAAHAAVIIDGTTANGGFESITGTPATDPYEASFVDNWFNLEGWEGIKPGTATWGGANDDDGDTVARAAYLTHSQKLGNSTGYTIGLVGEQFSVGFKYYGFGGSAGYTGDNSIEAYLVTTPTDTLDAGTTWGSVTVLGTYSTGNFERLDGATPVAQPLYTTGAADIGKTVFLVMGESDSDTTAAFPRIDSVVLEVSGGSTNPPTPTATNITIIAGSTGNADFEAEAPATGAIPYTGVAHWHNAGGADTINFTQDSQTAGSSQPNSRAGMPYQSRKQVNDTGYTVAEAGETFNLSYDFGRTGSNWDGDESMRTFLFTAAAVDANLTAGDMSEFASVVYTFPTNASWTTFSSNAFYTTTAGDVGKTVYFGMEHNNPAGNPVYPRIDVINLNIDRGAGSTNEPPANTQTGWEAFIAAYGLSDDLAADSDGDGQTDAYEFVHGGDPTNAASMATVPYLVYGAGGTVTLYSIETTNANPGLPIVAEWTDNLVTGRWNKIWSDTRITPAALSGYNAVERDISGATKPELFARVRSTPTTTRPNILLILADDLGYADVSFNVQAPAVPEITTPQLDSLAASGTIFSSAYVVHPFCGPSRMGLMAGRYPHEFGGPFNLPVLNSGAYIDQGISTNETMLSTVLQDADYFTGCIGKWHMGHEPQFHPNNRGFDEFYGFLGGGKNYFGPYQLQTGSVYDYKTYWEHNGVDVTDPAVLSNYLTDTLTDEGVNFINSAATNNEPFFLYMSYNAPHTPLEAKASDMAMFPSLSGDRKIYAGMVYAMDRGIGELVQALKDTGQYNDTLIIFLSDNGGRTDQGASNLPLKGKKGDVVEGGFRVPMLMHWPYVIASGATYDHPVSALDFYPTFARLADANIPAGKELDGKEIWDNVAADTSARTGESIYAVRHQIGSDDTFVGIRRDNWKATKWWTSTWKLYDIANDIGETTDLSGSYPTILSNMVQDAENWATTEHVRPLWFDSYSAEADWDANNMPHYDTLFTPSLP